MNKEKKTSLISCDKHGKIRCAYSIWIRVLCDRDIKVKKRNAQNIYCYGSASANHGFDWKKYMHSMCVCDCWREKEAHGKKHKINK